MAVDEASGVISHIQAHFADRRDSTLLPSIVAPLQQRLRASDLPLCELVADTDYSNEVNYALLEAQGITPWIPVFGKYKPAIDGFVYDAEADSFTCLAGKQLPSRRPGRPARQALHGFSTRLPPVPAQADLRPSPHQATAHSHGL